MNTLELCLKIGFILATVTFQNVNFDAQLNNMKQKSFLTSEHINFPIKRTDSDTAISHRDIAHGQGALSRPSWYKETLVEQESDENFYPELQGITKLKTQASANLSNIPYGEHCYIISKSTVQTLRSGNVHVHTDCPQMPSQTNFLYLGEDLQKNRFMKNILLIRRKVKPRLLEVIVICQPDIFQAYDKNVLVYGQEVLK